MEPSFHDQKPETGSPIKTAVSRSPILPPVNDEVAKLFASARISLLGPKAGS
jgi:hypothetical protein